MVHLSHHSCQAEARRRPTKRCNSQSRGLRPSGASSNMSDDANQRGPETGKHPDHFLAEWRTYRELSVRGLATSLGVSHSKISRIETGESELRPGFAKKLARFFNIPLAALFTVNPLGDGRETAEMLDAWAEIAPPDRPAALRMLRSLRRPSEDEQTG